MAIITLNPGESFEHIHSNETITSFVSGNIQLLFNDENIVLQKGQKILIPPNVSHVTKNIGNNIASFDCSGHTLIQSDVTKEC